MKPSRRPYVLTPNVTLRAPLVQACLGECDGPQLAGAVSRAGGLGCLTVTARAEKMLRLRLRRIRTITSRPCLVAFTSQWQRESVLETCLDEGVRSFQVYWWNGPRLAPRMRAANASVFWYVGNLAQAEDALDAGADVLVAQGTDAGGQVRGPHPLPELIAQIRDRFPDTPLVAGGGLATRQDVADVLAWGANAALLGTRFLLTPEARAPLSCKTRLARATANDLLLDPELVGDWPCAPRRRLPTRHGDHTALFAGAGLSQINTLLPAADVVRALTPALPPAYRFA